MLGLCWTPAAVKSMHKAATTVPSNPEQLLGAILVRKDIFYRFETTMNDTCLDANNLLEYLFSLYNSTAAPAERDNFPTPQELGFIRRDTNHSKKGAVRSHCSFPHQPSIANSQLTAVQGRHRGDSHTAGRHEAGLNEGHKRKGKTDQASFQGNTNFSSLLLNSSQSSSMKVFNSSPVFPIVGSNPVLSIQMEHLPEVESRQHTQPPSPLPPFSQIRHQSSGSYSPGLAQYSESLPVPSHDDDHPKHGFETSADADAGVVNSEIDESIHHQKIAKNGRVLMKHTRKRKLKGMHQAEGNSEIVGRRKKMHECFCGALFTRADNLKRHVRKCHEEKLEKLSSVPLDFNIDNSSVPVTDFSRVFLSSGQESLEPSVPHESQDPSQQQHPGDHQQQQQQDDGDAMKSTDGDKWSCFCGESFDDHRQLVEHTRTHEVST